MRRNVVGCKIALSTTPGVASKRLDDDPSGSNVDAPSLSIASGVDNTCLDGDLSDSSAVAPRRSRDAGLHALEPRSNVENTSTHAYASGV